MFVTHWGEGKAVDGVKGGGGAGGWGSETAHQKGRGKKWHAVQLPSVLAQCCFTFDDAASLVTFAQAVHRSSAQERAKERGVEGRQAGDVGGGGGGGTLACRGDRGRGK